jgi:hypothetical protein
MVLIAVHALIHFMGVAMVKTHPPYWWWVGFLGLALSQAVILSAWSDARFGTVANVLIALFALHAFAAEGPVGLRSEYREAVQARLPEELVGEITISAVLHFDESGELVDFVSDDRLAASPDGKTFLPLRWSDTCIRLSRLRGTAGVLPWRGPVAPPGSRVRLPRAGVVGAGGEPGAVRGCTSGDFISAIFSGRCPTPVSSPDTDVPRPQGWTTSPPASRIQP